ncbi:MAG: hypothetical protein IPL49_08225 [Saprospirales bacterium]|nr:hypothetical protein [Saprospirales bacterium]
MQPINSQQFPESHPAWGLACALFLLVVQLGSAQQKDYKDPWGSKNYSQGTYFEEGQLHKTGLTFYWDRIYYEIYEAAQNLEIKSGPFGNIGKGGKYYVLPIFSINQVQGPYVTSNGVVLNLDIRSQYPPFLEVAQYIQKNTTDRLVTPADIAPLKIFGYQVIDKTWGISDLITAPGGMEVNDNYPLQVTLKYPSLEEANEAKNFLLSTGKVQFSILLNFCVLVSECTFVIDAESILNSEAWRNIISPVRGTEITVDQALDLSNKLTNELRTEFYCKGNVSQFESLAQSIYQSLFSKHHSVPFEQLNAKNFLIDINGKRYQPDEINRLMTKISKESLNEWCDKYSDEKRDYDEKKNDLLITGETGGSFLNILEGSASATYDKDTFSKEESFMKYIHDNCGKILNKQSFDFEVEGSMIIPKGIFLTEVINSDHEFIDRFSERFRKVSQEYLQIPMQIGYRK